MFQNITDEIQSEDYIEDQNIKEQSGIKLLFKELFTKQNILIYILSFLVSMVGFREELFPFGLAMFAATCSIGMPVRNCLFINHCRNFFRFWIKRYNNIFFN